MKIDMPPEMVAFVIRHFKLRIEHKKNWMPNPDYIDPYIAMANGEDEKQAKENAREAKKKTLEFIHNATLVIDLLVNQTNKSKLDNIFSKV